MSTAAPEGTRNARRKQRNRARLLEAARAVMSRDGIAAATIAEITEEADLALGTFYNYFESKDDILDAVVSQTVAELGRDLDALTGEMTDSARVLATAMRHVLRTSRRDPVWAGFVVRIEKAAEMLARHLAHRARRDIGEGVRSGRFDVVDEGAALVALGGILLAGIRAQLYGAPAACDDETLSASALQLLGLPADEARAFASEPLPELRG